MGVPRGLIVCSLACLALSARLANANGGQPPAPDGTVAVQLGPDSETLWPYTGTDFTGTPSDPLNLVFLGDADPRQVRQALMSLGGDRTAYGVPNQFPFNCVWADAIGRHQTAWARRSGWQGSAIQMECGDYGSIRFHLRLFREGSRTLANAHIEVLIPGTTDHELLSWEFAEKFVELDIIRSGALAAAPEETPPINPAPSFRTIRTVIFNGLPVELRYALGLPLDDQADPVPLPTDGHATVLTLHQPLERERTTTHRERDQIFNQVIPRPFCSQGPLDYLKVQGPIHFIHHVETTRRGSYWATFSASGVLDVVPLNPLTGEVTGAPFKARITERHRSFLTDHTGQAGHIVKQKLLGEPVEWLFENLQAGRVDHFAHRVDCGDGSAGH
jgi:hypothetical protein